MRSAPLESQLIRFNPFVQLTLCIRAQQARQFAVLRAGYRSVLLQIRLQAGEPLVFGKAR